MAEGGEKLGTTTQPLLGAPMVSAIVTCRNCDHFVENAIRSVADQSYQQWECIIVDDASSDDSWTVIDKCLKQLNDARFSAIRLDEHSGQLAVMKAALAKASGSFVAFLDGDDMWLPRFLELHVLAHLGQLHFAAVTFSDSYLVDAHERVLAGTVAGVIKERGEQTAAGLHQTASESLNLESERIYVEAPREPNLHFIDAADFACRELPTSAMMFRPDLLRLAMPADDDALGMRAGSTIYELVHLLTGSILIDARLSLYRSLAQDSSFAWVGSADSSSHHARVDRAAHVLTHLQSVRPELERLYGARTVNRIVDRFDVRAELPWGRRWARKAARELRRAWAEI